MINSSLDWNLKKDELSRQIHDMSYNHDLRKMLRNIDSMVRDLSIAEVEFRRRNKDIKNSQELENVNTAIVNLEKWIMLAKLLA